MGLLSAIFGAKPPYGTPPFAQPHPNTGGAEVPRTPETMNQPHGLSGFIDRLVYPTSALGQFGQALVAGSGGPLSGAMGYLLQQGAERRKGHRKVQQVGDQIGILDEETGQFTPTYSAPKKREHHFWESNDGSLHDLDENGNPVEVYHDPTPKMNFIPDGQGGGQWVAVPNALPSGTQTPVGRITPIEDPNPADAPPAGGLPGSLAPNSQDGPNTPFGRLFDGLIHRESGGRAGIRGQQTQYGTPLGMTQLLPGTAREMATKLGVAWRPELLTGDTPEAAEYQQQLGQAYLREGLTKYGGDPRKALMYYHGGPNERLWGPKTRRYASGILSGIGG